VNFIDSLFFNVINKLCLKTSFRNDKKINLPSDFTIFRYTTLKSLGLAPLRLRFSTRLSKNGFIGVGKFIFSLFLRKK